MQHNTAEPIGLYIHIPFCRGKCPYCDFYSFAGSGVQMEAYNDALIAAIGSWAEKISRAVDTVYLGGGTPSCFGTQRLHRLLEAVHTRFCVAPDAQITLECNPRDLGGTTPLLDLVSLRAAGVNRLSLGVQSAVQAERESLGRSSNIAAVETAIQRAKDAGLQNISLDLMLGVPHQTQQSLHSSIEWIRRMQVQHVSAYLLKVEEGTPFAKQHLQLPLPDEEAQSELYLSACAWLEEAGFAQYEISNFARPGFASRHNLRYWDCREYLGIGPAAHSFLAGKRFFYPRDFDAFLRGEPPQADGDGGDFAEYAMLRLRLTQGLCQKQVQQRFGHPIPQGMLSCAQSFVHTGHITADADGFALTRAGFLLSNSILARLLEFA